VNAEIFKTVPELVAKMNSCEAGHVSDEVLSAQTTILKDLEEKYTKKGSPKEFKKVWKYDSLYIWANKFLEVVQAFKQCESIQAEVD